MRRASKIMQCFSVPNNKKILAQASICVNKKGHILQTKSLQELHIFLSNMHIFHVPVFYILNNKIFMMLHN